VSGALYCSYSATQNIIITEVGSNNTQFLPDSDNTVCDYIELHNPGSFPCAAEQLYLSDDASDLHKKEIPETIIPAHGFLLVALDDQSFQIDKHGGETIFLSDTRGHVLDQVTMVALEPDFSYCRVADTSENWEICSTTPGITNKEGVSRLDAAPRLSHSSGFYKEAFDLQITAQDGVTIYYTLDGSIPTTESEIYTHPIRVYNRSAEPNVWLNQQQVTQEWEAYTPDPTPVDKAFIIRAIGVDADGAVSKPVCATYFIGLEKYIGYNVVSLIVDPDDFWGEDGIYITGSEYDQWYRGDRTEEAPLPNFFKRGRLWERPAYFCYLSGDRVFEQDIGIRISGASARNKPKKRFSLFAREEYSGSDVFTENIFPDTQSKRLSLRSGFAAAFCQLLAPDRSFGIQRSEYVFLFLNGELWDIYSIMEKYDDLYFYEHYGVNPNNVVVMKGGILEEGIPGDELLLNEIYDYLAVHDLSDRDNYEAFSEILDIQSYIDYMCFNIYIDNLDFTEQKNAVWWRSREVTPKPFEDGKWRFLLYDLDAMAWDDPWLWGIDTKAEKNSFSLIPSFTDNQAINQQPIFAALAKNPEFRKRFVLTFMDLVNMHFRYETVQLALDAYTQRMELEDSGFYYTFFRDRAKYIVPYLAEEFALGGTPEPLHLGTNDHTAGYIQLNSITPDLSAGDWCGQYYTDYPVTVTAVANDGYVFKGWEGSVQSGEESLEVTLSTGGISLYAIFEKEAS